MNLQTKLLSFFLSVAMIVSLAACSNPSDPDADATPSPDTSDTTVSPEVSSILPEDFEPDPNVEDLYLAAAGIPGDFELFTVNGQPVSARMYLYWLASSISENESTYAYYGMTLDWSEELGLAEYMMADALNAALMYTLVPLKAKENGLELTADQITEYDALTADTIETMGGEAEFMESLRMLGLDRETYEAINRSPYYYDRILSEMFRGRPNDSDLAAYVEEKGILGAKHILLLTIDMTTRQSLADDVIAQKKAAAEDILKQLQESDDLASDFDALMHEYSEDSGLASNPNGYTFGSGEMVSEFENGTRALEIGQISGIVESPYGYHIILRQEPDAETLRAGCLSALAAKQISDWISEADVVLTDEYMNLDPQMFYEKFMAYQAVFSALRAAKS